MEFQYTLQRDEYLDCCKYEYLVDPTIRKAQHRCWPILPVVLIFLLVIFRPAHWSFYLGAAALCIGWIYLVNYLVARIVNRAAQEKCDRVEEGAFAPLRVTLDEGKLKVNGSKQTLENYRIFSNLILLFLKDGSTVALPARAVGGEDVEHIGPVLKELDKCLNT